MFVWDNVVILYDLGYIVTALDLQCLTIGKDPVKRLQFGLGIHLPLRCMETRLLGSSDKHPPCFYRLQKQPPPLFHACKSKGQEGLVFAYAGNGCLSWEFNPEFLSLHYWFNDVTNFFRYWCCWQSWVSSYSKENENSVEEVWNYF